MAKSYAQGAKNQAKDQAQDAKQQAEQASGWVKALAQAGFAAKGIVYAIVGVLAFQAAFGAGGQTTGSTGALRTIAAQPFGQILLVLVGIGLIGYVVWRFVQAAVDPDNKGSDAKGIATRLGYAVSGVIYAGLALTAFGIVWGATMGGGGAGGAGGGSSQQALTARLMSQPFGQWLVGIVGALVIGAGLYQIYKGITVEFRKKLKIWEMSSTEQTWAVRAGRLGLIARGIVLAMIGGFFIQAAWQAQPGEARGLGGALAELAQQPFGPWLLGIVALGLIAYGIYMGVLARYRAFPARA